MKGFTLVELLVVITIVGILAAVITLVINPPELLEGDATDLYETGSNLNLIANS